MNLADYIVSVLVSRGVRQVFGYPGAAIIPLMSAIDRHPDMEWILMRHEGCAALAASAAARVTKSLAVCLVTSGPGATNIVTGVIDAHVDRTPVLALTGLVPTWKQSRAGFQDLDQARMLSTLLTRSESCQHPDQLPLLLRDCIGLAEQTRDVVHLALPYDIQNIEIEAGDPRFTTEALPEKLILQAPPDTAFELVISALESFQQVAIIVGPRAFGAGPAIERLAVQLQAPIINSLDAKGIIDEDHHCSLGVLGIFGSPGVEMAQKILMHTDAILTFGIDSIAPFVVDQSGLQKRKLFQFEPDFSSISHQYHRTRTLVGPLEQIAETLTRRSTRREKSDLHEHSIALKQQFLQEHSCKENSDEYIHPADFLRGLSKHLEANAVLALDVGDNTVWSAQFLHLTQRQQVVVSNQLGTMGFALPAAIAAKLARPNVQVVGICGDGGFQMALAELLTAVQYKLQIVIAIFHNGLLQRVVAQQNQPVGTVLHNPDFVALARACGADAAVVDTHTDLDDVLQRAFQSQGPFLLDVRIGPDAKAPMSAWQDDFVPLHFS